MCIFMQMMSSGCTLSRWLQGWPGRTIAAPKLEAVMDEKRLLNLARRLHGLGRTGLHFGADEYDRQRYEEIEQIAAELLAAGASASAAYLQAEWAAETGYVTPKVEVRGAVFRAADQHV